MDAVSASSRRSHACIGSSAKRQLTWLRGEHDALWFDPSTARAPLDQAMRAFLGPDA